jgi:glycosyltransferase involved in cell wall biosynthesis
MISCLSVTMPSRLSLLELAVGDFAAQTHADAELVIVHDGDAEYDRRLHALARRHAARRIRVHAAQPGMRLGALRNLSVQLAQGDLVCQWDDDDRHHPQRLALQSEALRAQAADFCFLADQLHWFAQARELYWDDWDAEPYPMNFVHGTLLGRKASMPVYPNVARGEDTALVHEILRAGRRIAPLRDRGWAYVYVYHGGNVFDAVHHAAISRLKRYSGGRLLARERLLRERLAEYAPPLGALSMPYEGGALRFG